LTPLVEGHEIEWAETGADTLKEFPTISYELKLQGNTHYLDHNHIAQEASAQLLHETKYPNYKPLTNLFDWMKNSYDLMDRQTFKKVRACYGSTKI